jgi:DNA mismatch repair protein MutS
MTELTPLMKQYSIIKRNHPDCIVFFRLGDFYEMFGQDAVTASKILQITLTTRDKSKDSPVPMCGIPHFSAEAYISKLIKNGHKVAICEQMEDPKEAKGIVKRDVVRVVTPGTFQPENPKENYFIIGFTQKENIFGLAVADITTGDFFIYQSHGNIEDEIQRFEPKEIVYPNSLGDDSAIMSGLEGFYLTNYDDWYFDYLESYRHLLKHFRVASLDGYGCEGMVVAISAAGALLHYIEETQKHLVTFRSIRVIRNESYMLLDAATQRNLELTRNMKDGGREGSLISVIDETLTPMGGRLLRSWLINPLLDVNGIRQRQNAISSLINSGETLTNIRVKLKEISDIERLGTRVNNGNANARDLISLKNSLIILPGLKELVLLYKEERTIYLSEQIDLMPDIHSLIERSITEEPPHGLKEGGLIKKGFHKEIDELRDISGSGKDFVASLQSRERKRTGISSLKVGYNKVHGYYIEVTKPNLHLVPDDYIRKQTLVNGERFITPELKDHEGRILGAEERLKNLEYEIFAGIREKISSETERLFRTASAIAELDTLHSLAFIAVKYNYECPVISEDDVIQITAGRHPVLERVLTGEKFIPNDTHIDNRDHNILIITGPNMAGKSTYMRQTALIVLLAQMGSFVPVQDARIGLVDRIFTRIGASDVLIKGQSTFMVEMIETANILNNATQKSLILLDEVGRGTSTFDGISIAWAVAEYISGRLRSRTLFATHYHELTELSICRDGIKNLNVSVKEWGDEIIFLRKIEEGPADKSYGIQVARLAGLPEDTIRRAKEVLSNLEKAELNEIGTPKLAYSSESGASEKRRAGQLDLFTTQADPVLKEILGMDIMNLTPIEALNKLYEMRKRLSDSPSP